MDSALLESAAHTQRIAHKLGSAQMAVKVYEWAIKHAREIPAAPLKELMDIVCKEPE